MTASHFSGALIVTGQMAPIGGLPVDYESAAGPSLFYAGPGLLDPRTGSYPGSSATTWGWAGGAITVIDAVPSTLATANIAPATNPGTAPLPLVTTSGAGITAGLVIGNRVTGAQTPCVAIDGSPQTVPLTYGSGAPTPPTIGIYDPALMIGRNVRLTFTGTGEAGTLFTINGFDVYGYPMSENINGAGASTVSGKKAFKYVSSITHSQARVNTVNAGTGDIIGFPIRTDHWGQYDIYWADAAITATTGYLAAVTTDPATAITGDVRGTYALQSASDNTKRLIMRFWPSPASAGSITGLFGVNQFST